MGRWEEAVAQFVPLHCADKTTLSYQTHTEEDVGLRLYMCKRLAANEGGRHRLFVERNNIDQLTYTQTVTSLSVSKSVHVVLITPTHN